MSAIKPLLISNNSTNLVVCLPLPRASETSPVFNLRDASILFNKLDFPAPVCPHRATTEFENSFLILFTLVLIYTFIPIFL